MCSSDLFDLDFTHNQIARFKAIEINRGALIRDSSLTVNITLPSVKDLIDLFGGLVEDDHAAHDQ